MNLTPLSVTSQRFTAQTPANARSISASPQKAASPPQFSGNFGTAGLLGGFLSAFFLLVAGNSTVNASKSCSVEQTPAQAEQCASDKEAAQKYGMAGISLAGLSVAGHYIDKALSPDDNDSYRSRSRISSSRSSGRRRYHVNDRRRY